MTGGGHPKNKKKSTTNHVQFDIVEDFMVTVMKDAENTWRPRLATYAEDPTVMLQAQLEIWAPLKQKEGQTGEGGPGKRTFRSGVKG